MISHRTRNHTLTRNQPIEAKQFNAENQNAVPNLKKPAVLTRSRAALGNIQNVLQKPLGQLSKSNIPSLKKSATLIKPTGPSERKQVKTESTLKDSVPEVSSSGVASYDQPSFIKSRNALREHILSTPTAIGDIFQVDNIDSTDVQMVSDYAIDIFDYLQHRELTVQPLDPKFISTWSVITPRMRYILVDWLTQVHAKFTLVAETLHLCIAIMDRYLQFESENVAKDSLQLLGVTCLFIASKFEEIYAPEIIDFVAITDNSYNEREIRNLEARILETLDFYLSIPLPLVFLRRFTRIAQADAQSHNMAKYLLELTLQEYELCSLPGNLRASSALCLALTLLVSGSADLSLVWTPALRFHSGLEPGDLEPTVRLMARVAYRHNAPSKFRAIFNKYSCEKNKFLSVSLLPNLNSSLICQIAGDA